MKSTSTLPPGTALGTPREVRGPWAKKHPRHNRELKRLRKVKTSTIRELYLAERERKLAEVVRTLRGKYLKATRSYSKALKRSKRLGDARMSAKAKKECTDSFWKFATKTLDTTGRSYILCTRCRSYLPRHIAPPCVILPSLSGFHPSQNHNSFDCDPIRLDEVICVIKQAKASSSPSPHDTISYNILKKCLSLAIGLVMSLQPILGVTCLTWRLEASIHQAHTQVECTEQSIRSI